MTTPSPLADEVCDLLSSSVADVLVTAFDLGPIPTEPAAPAAGEIFVTAAVGFTGEAHGMVYVHVPAAFAQMLTRRMLGLAGIEGESDDIVNDVVGEFGNMVVGAVKSRLCDAGHPCVLTIPTIVRGTRFQAEATARAERRELFFRCGSDLVAVELLMKPGR